VRLAILWDAISVDQFGAAERRGKALGLKIQSLKLENPPYDFDAVFRTLAGTSPQMLLVLSSPNFTPSRVRIAELAIRYRLPAMFIFKTYVQAGGLLSYGVDYVAMHRQAARYVAKILMGAKPADLPSSSRTTRQIRDGRQPQDRKGTWADGPAIAPAARRRGNPVMNRSRLFAAFALLAATAS
jgi:putative ABC transport system substrate-binding protein